jgi:ribonuclease HI
MTPNLARRMGLQAYTDGASSPGGCGGWAYVIVEDDVEIRRASGSALGVTHQRMEIRAVAEALRASPVTLPLEVVGDSAYVIDCFLEEWHVRWESNGWRNYSRRPVANRDEWERAIGAWREREATTTWTRIKGHNGDKWNELVDGLAVAAKLNPFQGSRPAATAAAPATRRISRRASWRDLPAAEMAAHLLRTPTISDRAWTEESRLPRETRAAFIHRVLLSE